MVPGQNAPLSTMPSQLSSTPLHTSAVDALGAHVCGTPLTHVEVVRVHAPKPQVTMPNPSSTTQSQLSSMPFRPPPLAAPGYKSATCLLRRSARFADTLRHRTLSPEALVDDAVAVIVDAIACLGEPATWNAGPSTPDDSHTGANPQTIATPSSMRPLQSSSMPLHVSGVGVPGTHVCV